MENNEWWGKLDLPEPKGENEQETADPANDGTSAEEGGNEQGAAAPAGAETKPTIENEPEDETDEEEQDDEGGNTPAQTKEQNREQAKQRRTRYRKELEAEIRRQTDEQHAGDIKMLLNALGVKDADTGKNIETIEEFKKFQSKQRAAQAQRDLKAGKLSMETLGAAVLETPEIKSLLESASAAKAAADEAQSKARLAQFNANMQTELAEIRKLNPEIRTTDDIVRMETGPEFARLVRTGLRPSEAYKLANFEALQAGAKNAAEQAARNAAAGKAHMQQTPKGGKPAISVPEDYKQNMRRFNDGITDEEIARYYEKYQKERS